MSLDLPILTRRVHPRVCGENRWMAETTEEEAGSSPRVRGKLFYRYQAERDMRFIPACAGKTPWRCRTHSPSPVHPRVCGENYEIVIGSETGVGSSPRVRGKHRGAVARIHLRRFIPACAGKTMK